jgi:Nse4 C-terminal
MLSSTCLSYKVALSPYIVVIQSIATAHHSQKLHFDYRCFSCFLCVYAQTVENIFDFSFDIKEGLAELSRDTVSYRVYALMLHACLNLYILLPPCSNNHCAWMWCRPTNVTNQQTQLNCANRNIHTAMLQLLILLLLPLLLLLLLLLQATGALKLQRREALMDEKTSAKNNQTVLSFNLQDYYDMIELYNLEGKAPVIPARTGADYFDPLEKQPDVPDDDAAADDDDSDSGAYYCCCCCLPCMTHCCAVCATVYVQREGSSIAALVPQCVAVNCRCIKHAFYHTAVPPLISLYW